ncbi:GATA transcription factor [Striga asiatica]|uniref:GATA transcription factor n=1 Tax=Striga asiatica TaxID=4170 RepID=A0A5A7RDN6_STRAF|nr:GATA transcription factor [Striga asiatica]
MECIETRALKSSALSQMNVNHNDDVWCLAGINAAVLPSSDDNFPVDDLLNLDFHDKDHLETCFSKSKDEESVFLETNSNHSTTTFSAAGADESDSLSAAGELVVPADLENLEWLSQFVDDDSTAGLSLLCPVGIFPANGGVIQGKRAEHVNRTAHKIIVPFLPSPVPRKPRTKLPTRPSARRPYWLCGVDKPAVSKADQFIGVRKPPVKRRRKAPEEDAGRRCTHCQVSKTPQWRTGPLGPKTLCNACGVRFKSGRLFPEYRPACSPSFSKEMHSNSHRKVLEMRRKKEGCEGA